LAKGTGLSLRGGRKREERKTREMMDKERGS
jgi:hypothetical protein